MILRPWFVTVFLLATFLSSPPSGNARTLHHCLNEEGFDVLSLVECPGIDRAEQERRVELKRERVDRETDLEHMQQLEEQRRWSLHRRRFLKTDEMSLDKWREYVKERTRLWKEKSASSHAKTPSLFPLPNDQPITIPPP